MYTYEAHVILNLTKGSRMYTDEAHTISEKILHGAEIKYSKLNFASILESSYAPL